MTIIFYFAVELYLAVGTSKTFIQVIVVVSDSVALELLTIGAMHTIILTLLRTAINAYSAYPVIQLKGQGHTW